MIRTPHAWSRRGVLSAGAGFAAASCNLPAPAQQAPAIAPEKVLGEVARISPELDAIVPPGAVVEKLGEGFVWAEGPLWIREGNYLLFTDVPANIMRRWDEQGGVTEFLNPSGRAGDTTGFREPGANGLARAADGSVLMADCGNRCIARLDLATKQKTVVAGQFEGKKFNSPNDIAVHSSGAFYFTDPPYGLEGINDSPLRETPYHGVYRVAPDGSVALFDDSLMFPNGVALSPDERILYVACSDDVRAIVMAYTLDDDGMPTTSAVFFDAAPLKAPDKAGAPDGLKVDEAGRLFQTGPGGVLVLSPGGELLGVIGAGGRPVANCAFGEDGLTLFLTADDAIGRIRLNTRAAHWG